MGFPVAFLICSVGVAGLFYLDRDRQGGNAKALWLPVVWLWIIGSRPVSAWLFIWFGIGQTGPTGLDAQLDGSPIDAFVFLVVLSAGIAVLFRRKRQAVSLLKRSTPLSIYLLYCLVSCSWSPFPDVAFKRWIKIVGDLIMVLVVVTDPKPKAALGRLFSRVGFILFPASILLIRYSTLGQVYDADGGQMYTGAATNKNTLGQITYVVALGAFWNCLQLLRTKKNPERTRRLVAQATLLVFGLAVLQQARSSTSTSCFLFGSFLMIATNRVSIRRCPQRVHVLFAAIMLISGVSLFFGGTAMVAGAFGKNPNLGDRTIIWAAAIPACPNPVIGAGFESFWNGYGRLVRGGLSKYEIGLNEAHNGYIEVYLNLGWVGVCMIAILLIGGYLRAYSAFRRGPDVGTLMLAYVATASIYCITEAGFRIMTPNWIVFLVVFVGSESIVRSLRVELEKRRWRELHSAASCPPPVGVSPQLVESDR